MQYFREERLNDLAMRLRAFAEAEGAKRGLNFWNILRTKAIVSICRYLPTTIEDLNSKQVLVGKKTIERYGQAIVDIVNEWLSEGDANPSPKPSPNPTPKPAARVDNVMCIRQGGFYYNVSGNDALLLHKHLGYKLYGVKVVRTGFPVRVRESVLKRLDVLSIDYDLINQAGEVILSKRFDENCYEIVSEEWAAPVTPKDIVPKEQKKPFKERVSAYITILQGLSENVDVITGEVVEGLSDEVRLQLFEMSLYFDERLKRREAKDNDYPDHGKPWTPEEDEALLAEYREGMEIKELSEKHHRTPGAIRSRLLKLTAIL